MNVYLAGPMSGLEDYNYQAFAETATAIKAMGHHPVHTANLPRSKRWEYSDYMAYSKTYLKECDCIFMLDGWENSVGAKTEYVLARLYGIGVVYSLKGLERWHGDAQIQSEKNNN